MRKRRHHTAAILASLVGAFLWVHGCAAGGEEAGDFLCQPGENIFCRCPGGEPGTKPCLETGQAFGECEICEDRPENGPAGQGGFGASGPGPGSGAAGPGPGSGGDGGDPVGAGGAGGAGVGGGAGQGGGGTGSVPLLGPCAVDGDCMTGMCRFNYCTKPCTLVTECPWPESECVPGDAGTMCMPTCSTAVDCAVYTAPPSQCGYTQAVDGWDVTTCAFWDPNHQLMPPGTDCLPFDHEACNLGYQKRATVCTEQGVCAMGCYTQADCPTNTLCSSNGSLGNCN